MTRWLSLLLALVWAEAAQAREFCRLALSLAIDVSSSVDRLEYRLQKDGLIAALLDEEVNRALFSVPNGYVAMHIYEWSGRYQQDVLVDWTELRSQADLVRMVGQLSESTRTYAEFPTALGYALGFATFEFRRVPHCARRTVDVSGDGVNNDGFGPELAQNSHDFTDTIVNGLVIGRDPELKRYYETSVIYGPGAFVMEALSFRDFGPVMRRKLIRELGEPQLGYLAPKVQ